MTPMAVMNPPEVWQPFIKASHEGFIATEFLCAMGEIYRREFEGERFKSHETIAPIPASLTGFDQAEAVTEKLSGFDLPSLFLPQQGWSGQCVGILGQDPLRRDSTKHKWPSCLTCCNPWGLSHPQNRQKRFGRMVWTVIEGILQSGHGVYLTDLEKIYVPGLTKSVLLQVQERAVFHAEVAAVSPLLWVTFGQRAAAGARAAIPDGQSLVGFPHPNAHGRYLQRHFNAVDGRHMTTAAQMLEAIAPHLA